MNLGFDDDQLAFRDAVRDLLTAECPPEVVRATWEADVPPWPVATFDKLLAMSAGTGDLEQVLLFEESGRVAFPGPLVEHLVSGVDDGTATVAFESWPLVTYAGDVDVVVVATESGLVRHRSVGAERVPTVDGARRLYRVTLGDGEAVAGDAGLLFDRAVLGISAQLLGLGSRMLEMAVEYAKERRQFGVAIGTQQAVKHHLANVAIALAYARPVVHAAAWSVAEAEPDRSLRVSMAKAFAGDAATRAARAALQVHGAIGYAVEHDLHLWMKRAWALAAQWGDARWHRERVAAELGL